MDHASDEENLSRMVMGDGAASSTTVIGDATASAAAMFTAVERVDVMA